MYSLLVADKLGLNITVAKPRQSQLQFPTFITSAEEGGYVFSSVCLSVCLFVSLSVCLSVCLSDYSQTCERILTKFFGGVGHGSGTK